MIRQSATFASFVCVLLLAAATAPPAQAASDELFGVWRNPKDSVRLEIRPCGDSACGYVVWASPKAQEDARRGSGENLIGQQLLRDFAPGRSGWRGKVFVPDLNHTFSGSARVLDASRLEAQGCLLGGLFCKRQIWTRVADARASR
jgi:uncharacterized protein (DUF2147 family)